MLILDGESAGHLGQSIYAREAWDRASSDALFVDKGGPEGPRSGGAAPRVDLALEKKNGDFVRALIADGLVCACHDLSDGGLGCAAAEMALGADIGIALGYQGDLTDAAFLYGEDQGRYLIALPAGDMDALEHRARAAGVDFLVVGETGGRALSYLGRSGARETLALDDLRRAHEAWLPAYMKVAH
jgi:phosphoribosylformylglycinamidine synthase